MSYLDVMSLESEEDSSDVDSRGKENVVQIETPRFCQRQIEPNQLVRCPLRQHKRQQKHFRPNSQSVQEPTVSTALE